jgi:hypothetical protein
LLVDFEKAHVERGNDTDCMQGLLNFPKIATIITTSEIPHHIPKCCMVRIHIKLSVNQPRGWLDPLKTEIIELTYFLVSQLTDE